MPTIYAAMREALLVVDVEPGSPPGDGSPPDPTRRLDGHDLECVAAHPEAPEQVLVGTFDSGLHRSTDGGETFERVGADDIESEAVMAVAVDHGDPDLVWAGTEPSAVYRSTDGGATWEARPGISELPSEEGWYFPPRPHTHHVRWIEPAPDDPSRLYVGIEAGALVRTDDAGETWRDRPDGARIDNHSLATHPDAPGRVYAAAGDGYAVSDDGGDTWAYPQEGLEHTYCWSVAPAVDDPETVVLSSASGPRQAHSPPDATSYVYRRTSDGDGGDGDGGDGEDDSDGVGGHDGDDSGGGWTRSMDGLPGPEGLARAVLDVDPGTGAFYALTNRGIFRSTDDGRSWTDLNVGWDEAFVSQTPRGLAVI